MFSCNAYNIRDYKISISPVSFRKWLKGRTTYSWAEMATWSTGYLIPYFSSQAIDFLLQAEHTSDKPLTPLNYKWELFLVDKDDLRRITSGEGTLRGGDIYKEFIGVHKSKGDRIVVDKPRIPSAFISFGEYILMVQLSYNKQAITNWLPMVKFNVINSGNLAVQLMLGGMGILGVFIGVVLSFIAAYILNLLN